MKALCAYYNNPQRIGLVLSKLETEQDVCPYALTGTIIRGHNAIKCIGDVINILVSSDTSCLPVLLSTDKKMAEFNNKPVDVDITLCESPYLQILRLCAEKSKSSGNAFSLECSVGQSAVIASAHRSGRVVYTIKTPSGNMQTESSRVPSALYSECQGIKSFQYSVITDTCEKDVVVKKGQLEVFREIAHFVNKGLLFTSRNEDGSFREVCVTPTGCCEARISKTGEKKIVKVPYTRLRLNMDSAISAIDCNLDVLLRATSFSQVVRGVYKDAKD